MPRRASAGDRWRAWRRRFAALLRPRTALAETEAELAFHVDMQTLENIRAGMHPDEARRAARAAFGGVSQVAEDVGDVRAPGVLQWLEHAARDIRLALRGVRRAPVFTLALIATIAVGAGANGAVFSILRATLLQPLPYHDPERLVMVWLEPLVIPASTALADDDWWRRGVLTPREVLAWRERLSGDVAEVAAAVSWATDFQPRYDLHRPEGAIRINGAMVTPNFFQVLGAPAVVGRVFTPADANAGPTVVLSHALWLRAFGGDSTVVGRRVSLTGESPRQARTYTVAGVMPPGFRFTYPDDTELWTLMAWSVVERWHPQAITYTTVARLRDGVTLEQARARAAALHDGISPPRPGEPRWSFALEPVREWVVEKVRPSLLLLGGVAALLLVITCATVGNALLARLSTRQQELAVRTALGASRATLLRQLLAEGFVLAIAGTAAGALVVFTVQPVLRRLLPGSLPLVGEVETSAWILAFTLGVAALITLLGGLGPAITGSFVHGLDRVLRGTRSASAGRSAVRLRRATLAAQAGVSTVLLIAAALLLVSFWHLNRVPLGFDGSRVIALDIRLLDGSARGDEGMRHFRDDLLERVRATPGVQLAGITSVLPFRDQGGIGVVRLPGDTTEYNAKVRMVDSAYFQVLRVPLLRGRYLSAGDVQGAEPVTVLSASFARGLFGALDPIGRQVVWGDTLRVVGVVGDMRYAAVDREPAPAMYRPWEQDVSATIAVMVRASRELSDIGPELQRAVRDADSTVPLLLTTVDAILDGTLAGRRFYTVAAAAFAAVGFVLTIVGLAMIVGRAVSERRRELAIRAALGATDGTLMRFVSREAVLAVALGAAVGTLITWIASGALQRFMFGVTARSIAAYAFVALGLVAVATAASLGAARGLRRVRLPAVMNAE